MGLQNKISSTAQLTRNTKAEIEKRHPNQGVINDLRADHFRPAEGKTVTSFKSIMKLYRRLLITQCMSPTLRVFPNSSTF